MLKRRLIQALLLGVPATASLSMTVSIAHAAEECRLKPGSTAPSGARWLYRINPIDHRHCWFLSSKAAITHSHLAHRYRHLAGDPEAARQDQQSDSDLQTDSALADNPDIDVAAKPPLMSRAASPSVEQSSDDLVVRSVPTIVYRLPPASVQTMTDPTVPAQSVRSVTRAATGKWNVVLLAGAALVGLCFAGGVFHFTRRVHRSARLRGVAYGLGVREPVGVRPLVDAIPLQNTSDLLQDVEQSVRNLKRDRRRTRENLPLSVETHDDDAAVCLPHAAAWLSPPKAKPRTLASYQLADA
jgi:hypothetical protein